MGLLNILSPISNLFGSEKQQMQTPAAVEKDPGYKSPEEIAADEEAKKKAALLAANAGGQPATTVGGGNADVTQKTLLGL